jgi:hypothetical protein
MKVIRALYDSIDHAHTGRISEEMFAPYGLEVMKCWKKLGAAYTVGQVLGDPLLDSAKIVYGDDIDEGLFKDIRETTHYNREHYKNMLLHLARVIFDRVLFHQRREAWRAARAEEEALERHLHAGHGSGGERAGGGVVAQLLVQRREAAHAMTWQNFSTFDWTTLLPRLVATAERRFRRKVMINLPGTYLAHTSKQKKAHATCGHVVVGGFIKNVEPVWFEHHAPDALEAEQFRLKIDRFVIERSGEEDPSHNDGAMYLDDEYELEVEDAQATHLVSDLDGPHPFWKQVESNPSAINTNASVSSTATQRQVKKRRAYYLVVEAPHDLLKGADGTAFALRSGSNVAIDTLNREVVLNLNLTPNLEIKVTIADYLINATLRMLELNHMELINVSMKRFNSRQQELEDRHHFLIAIVPLRDVRLMICQIYFQLP